MTGDQNLVIIGGGFAGAKAAEGARASGFDGRIVLVGEEQGLPYERPPLSKAVLRGEAPPESADVHDAAFYADNRIELVTGRAVEALEPAAHRVRLSGGGGSGDGETLTYTAAVLATGAAPRRLDIPGADLDGVHYLRTRHDARGLADAIRAAGRVAVIGAGWIGSEVAASARQMGADVVMIDPGPVPLRRVLGERLGHLFRQLHADHGVALRLGSRVAALHGRGAVDGVVLGDGEVEPADVVVVGIGVAPRVELAVAAGLEVDDGVVVDDRLRTSAPDVYAAGDVASAWHPLYGRHLRVEHWSNALHQGLVVGANATGGDQAYTRPPYFFSDQYDLGMEYVGQADPTDDVVIRGSLEDRELIAFWHRAGVVTAAMNVNVWDVADDLRTLVTSGLPVDLTKLADPTTPLPI
jgi:3-phenylpropionate/trans-cinnamate dioxygenase ferredoxin reductase component